jgi:hypothetical protein
MFFLCPDLTSLCSRVFFRSGTPHPQTSDDAASAMRKWMKMAPGASSGCPGLCEQMKIVQGVYFASTTCNTSTASNCFSESRAEATLGLQGSQVTAHATRVFFHGDRTPPGPFAIEHPPVNVGLIRVSRLQSERTTTKFDDRAIRPRYNRTNTNSC